MKRRLARFASSSASGQSPLSWRISARCTRQRPVKATTIRLALAPAPSSAAVHSCARRSVVDLLAREDHAAVHDARRDRRQLRDPSSPPSIDSSSKSEPSRHSTALISMYPCAWLASANPSRIAEALRDRHSLGRDAAAVSNSPAASCLEHERHEDVAASPRSRPAPWRSSSRCARPIHAPPGPISPRVVRRSSRTTRRSGRR